MASAATLITRLVLGSVPLVSTSTTAHRACLLPSEVVIEECWHRPLTLWPRSVVRRALGLLWTVLPRC